MTERDQGAEGRPPPKGGEAPKNPKETRSKKRNPPPGGKRNRRGHPAGGGKGGAAGGGNDKKSNAAVLTGPVPEWAKSTAIAQLLGKTTRRIQQLTQDGILKTEVPPGGGARKYRTCDTIQRYIDHVERKAQEIGEGGRLAELNLKKLEAEVALKESQGSLHRLKTAIAEGKYLPAEQATEELAEFMTAFQKFAMTIPARMAGAMSGYADAITIRNAQKAIRKELETMLTAYVDAMQVEDTPGAEP